MSRRDIFFLISIATIPMGMLAISRYETVHDVKTAIGTKLVNADGARFKNIRRTENGQICGEVNAKNNNGEYQGFRFFYVSNLLEKQTVWIDSDSVKLAQKMCKID